MVIDALVMRYPTFALLVLLSAGIIYFTYGIARNYAHFHWNLFLIATGLMGAGFLIGVLRYFYPYGLATMAAATLTALSAVTFAFTAYVASVSDKKWR